MVGVLAKLLFGSVMALAAVKVRDVVPMVRVGVAVPPRLLLNVTLARVLAARQSQRAAAVDQHRARGGDFTGRGFRDGRAVIDRQAEAIGAVGRRRERPRRSCRWRWQC